MKRTFTKILSVVLCAVMVLGAAPLGGLVGLDLPGLFDFKADAATYSGKCGDNLTWSLDTDTGVLNINGTGAMKNYTYSSAPWFSYRRNIKSVNISNGVTNIGDYAFYYFISLPSVTIPDSVTTIGRSAFSGCNSLTRITVDANNNNYSSNSDGVLFNKDKTTLIQYPIGNTRISYTISDSVTTIGDDAFASCYSLTSVTIPDSVTAIDYGAFRDCDNLTDVTMGNSVTSIGDYAFSYCDSLTSVTIGNSVTTIGNSAFYYCDSLTSVTIPYSVTTIGDDAFFGCDILTSVTVDKNNKNYSSDSYGVLFNKDKTTLIQYPLGNTRTSYTIPDSVTTISYAAFYSCSSLTSIIIPDSVTSIGEKAFSFCYNLTSVTIGNSVTAIDYGAFRDCDNLTDVYYLGSEEQWKAISIGDYNKPLLNATIHFNSIGSENDNASGNEPSDEEKYKNATITLDKDSYTVKEPNLLKITGKIICPDGVESLSVDTNYSSADFYLFSLNYEMISNTEKIFVATFSAKNPGEFKIGFLFPDLSKSVKCTVKSYKSCAPAYISEHLEFIESAEYTSLPYYPSAEFLADHERGDINYIWNNFITVNIFENYYDLVLAELLTGTTMSKSIIDLFTKNNAVQISNFANKIAGYINSVSDIELTPIEIEEFLDILNSNNPEAYKNSTLYKKINSILKNICGNDKYKIIDKFFKVNEDLNVAGKLIGAELDFFEGLIECIYYYSAIEAYKQTRDEVKEIIRQAAEITDNDDLRESLETYVSIDDENDEINFAEYILENRANTIFETSSKMYLNLIGFKKTTSFILNIPLIGGKKLADLTIIIKLKSGKTLSTTIGKCASGASAILTGVTLGMAVSSIITNADDYALYMSKCIHAGDFAKTFAKVMKSCEYEFRKSKTIEDASLFDAAFKFYRDIQIYALISIVESVYAQENSFIGKIFNRKGYVSNYISKINCYQNLKCHEHEPEDLVTGEYYYIDEKYLGNKVACIACPVDVYVYDSQGNLALSIENDFVEIFDDRLNAYVLNSEKYICVPLDEEFTIKIVSTDAGEMDYSVFEFNENSEMTREVSKENISLETNKTFDGKINNVPYTDADNYNLTVSGTQEKIAMENDIDCVPATDIEVSESTVSLKVGQSKTLYATVSPSNTTDKFSWISSDETVATVSENGVVKAIGEGKATIIAIFNDLIYAECEIDVVDSKDYTVCWTVDGVSTFRIFTEGDSITKPVNPEKKGYEFVGWTPEIPTTMPAENLTFTAQFELNVKEIKIKTPSTTTINYGETLVLQLEDVELPEGYTIEWSIIGNAVTMSVSEDGKECRVTSTASGNVSVTATVVDENGELVPDNLGNNIESFINISSKAGFWQKLISFFKNLFRINRIIY